MSRKMYINRLDKDELVYELSVRGIGIGTCEEMRHRLALAIQMEKSGDSFKYPAYPFSFDEDHQAVKKKLDELVDMIDQFNKSKDSGEALKIQSKLSHTFGRIDNMEIEEGEQDKGTKKSDLVALALSLMDRFQGKCREFEKEKANVPAALSLLESQIGSNDFHAHLSNAARSSPIDGDNQRGISVSPGAVSKVIPPHKWDLKKFSGDGKIISVNAFFERVEELRIARNVSEATLLDAGIDLFTDKAYQFYKDCRSRVQSWNELVEEFKGEYLSANHNEMLFEELQRRTQHHSETIGVYLAVMSGYFNRMGCIISEEAKLSIILKNLHPFYQDRLRDPLPTSLTELRAICRRMEARRDLINSYVEPTRRGHVLEKDLAFVEVSEAVEALDIGNHRSENSEKKEIICFRCKKAGHKAIGCVLPKRKYCYNCNRVGYTVRDCPNCSRQGNASRRS